MKISHPYQLQICPRTILYSKLYAPQRLYSRGQGEPLNPELVISLILMPSYHCCFQLFLTSTCITNTLNHPTLCTVTALKRNFQRDLIKLVELHHCPSTWRIKFVIIMFSVLLEKWFGNGYFYLKLFNSVCTVPYYSILPPILYADARGTVSNPLELKIEQHIWET